MPSVLENKGKMALTDRFNRPIREDFYMSHDSKYYYLIEDMENPGRFLAGTVEKGARHVVYSPLNQETAAGLMRLPNHRDFLKLIRAEYEERLKKHRHPEQPKQARIPAFSCGQQPQSQGRNEDWLAAG